MTLGPPPPGTWRRNDDGYVPKDSTHEARTRDYVVLPRDIEYLTKQPARPFVAADDTTQELLTVLLFTSPVPSHPDPWLLRWVYDSIRVQLPKARIVVLADGVDGEEPSEYVEFKDNVRKLGWELVDFKGWHYHTLMLKDALESVVKTPLVLIGEHDWAFRPRFIDWRGITSALLDTSERFRLVQLRQATVAGWEAPFLSELVPWYDIRLLPTTHFLDSVHVANCDWYRELASLFQRPQNLEGSDLTFFLRECKKLHQMACYIPTGPMGRLYHLDGAHVRSPKELDGVKRSSA